MNSGFLFIKMKNYFDSAISYGSLRKALNQCCRNVRWKDSVVGYELHAAQNTYKLRQDLLNGAYKISPYQHFTIYEPKLRQITATRIRDRQVQMALCEGGLYDDVVEHFIYDNCACQKGKGTDFAIKRMRIHLNRYYKQYGADGWVLRCDIRHFFQETSHTLAKQAIKKRVEDPKVCRMVCDVIDSFGGDKGIGLGSQISQLVELAVLDDLDHFIKERLHIKYYIRYMDDFILIHPDKAYLEYCLSVISQILSDMDLQLNEKTTIHPLRQGVKFLQWRFVLHDNGKIVQTMNPKKLGKQRRRIRKLLIKERDGKLSFGTALYSFTSWKANANRGDSYCRIQNMNRYYKVQKEAVFQ